MGTEIWRAISIFLFWCEITQVLVFFVFRKIAIASHTCASIQQKNLDKTTEAELICYPPLASIQKKLDKTTEAELICYPPLASIQQCPVHVYIYENKYVHTYEKFFNMYTRIYVCGGYGH